VTAIFLDTEADPAAEPDDMDVDEPHRSGEGCDGICDAVLAALRSLPGLLDEGRIRLEREVGDVFQKSRSLLRLFLFFRRARPGPGFGSRLGDVSGTRRRG
jgi:hypothetical protein